MKKILLLLLLILLVYVSHAQILPQENYTPKSDPNHGPIPIYKDQFLSIPPPESYIKSLTGRTEGTKSTFIVTYIGFGTNTAAKNAFQKAVDIWSNIIVSAVPIRIEANWKALGSGVLGSASPSTYYLNFKGATKAQTWYPIALADKMAKYSLNGTNADITANFNSAQTSWYYGTDGNVPSGKYDLTTVVLHEIGHGLGFVGFGSVSGNQGSLRYSGSLSIFDSYLENSSSVSLSNKTSFPDPSSSLNDAFLQTIVFNSPITVANGGLKPVLYTPQTYSSGSSIYHYDQSLYSGTPNGLMCPQLPSATSNLNPGVYMYNMFADMGWIHTYLEPDTLKSTETVSSSYDVKMKVTSDTLWNASSLEFYYSADSFKTKTKVIPTATANQNEYSATIPSAGSGKTLGYYLTAKDLSNRVYQAPSEATTYSNYFYFYTGPDNIAPKITHTPAGFLFLPADTIPLSVTTTDVFGINQVAVEYLINDVAQTSFTLTQSKADKSVYSGRISFPSGSIKANDIVKYRILSKDNSNAKNIAYSPSSGYYSVPVQAVKSTQDQYSTDFSSATVQTDFLLTAFTIGTSSGFSDASLNSEHPYKNGSGTNNESNYIAQMRVPIKIKSTNALMAFDEIVLVEPGESGSTFGSASFYDYVVVEGSKDGGKTWKTVADGYDCRANSIWEQKYNSSISGQNSTASGDPSLYRNRKLDISKSFVANDEVIFRFRLFADAGAYGWGWSIDNLKIQTSDLVPTVVITGLEDVNNFKVTKIYPNPNDGYFSIETPFTGNGSIKVTSNAGVNVFESVLEGQQSKQINLSSLTSGIYNVEIQFADKKLVRRIFINK